MPRYHKPDDNFEKNLLPVPGSGKWRELDKTPQGISKRDLKMAEDLNEFLFQHKVRGGDIFSDAREWALNHKYTKEQNDMFRRLLDTYLRLYPEKERGS